MSLKAMLITEGRTDQPPDDIYDDGYLRVEHRNYYVACGGVPLKFPRTEFLIVSRLTATPNRIVPADDLWSSVWGANKPLNPESLHVYMYRVRVKLAEYGLQIETMVNVGYRLITSNTKKAAIPKSDDSEFRT
jgi:DNA-binding response OmpR family regulator